MTNIDREPSRREHVTSRCRLIFPYHPKTALPRPGRISTSFAAALSLRRSANEFVPIEASDLSTWLHYSASVQAHNASDPNRQQRFVPSFGALHPAHILVGSPTGKWSVYLPNEHALGGLMVNEAIAFKLRRKATELFNTAHASLIALVSDSDFVAGYYDDALGLMLRDGGVLLGHASLVASALGLGFRILGCVGKGMSDKLVRNVPFRGTAVGLAWIGGKNPSS